MSPESALEVMLMRPNSSVIEEKLHRVSELPSLPLAKHLPDTRRRVIQAGSGETGAT